MEDDDIRQLLHSTYSIDSVGPTVVPGALGQHPRRRRRSGLLTSLIAAAVVIVVAVPIGAGVLFRTGVIGGAPASTMHVFDLKMFGAYQGWAWAGGDNILHTTSGVQQWAVVPPPIGSQLITGVAWAGAELGANPHGSSCLPQRHRANLYLDSVGDRRRRRNLDEGPPVPSTA